MSQNNPQNADAAERALLGSILRYSLTLDDVVPIVERKEILRTDAHQKIYAAMLILWQRGEQIDTVSVFEQIHRSGHYGDLRAGYLQDLYDGEPTGAHAAYYAGLVRDAYVNRELSRIAVEIAELAAHPTGTAPDVLAQAEKLIFDVATQQCAGEAFALPDTLAEAVNRIDARKRGELKHGLPTGWGDLDESLGGWRAGELILIGARPAVGKTALAVDLTRNLVRDGLPVLFVSLEQSRVELADRLLASQSRINSSHLRTGKIGPADLERLNDAYHDLRQHRAYIADSPNQSVLQIAATARRHVRRFGVAAVVVDYLQLVAPRDRKVPRHEQVAEISRGLKLLARDLNIPVIALCQVNRSPENRSDGRPRLSDLRESGAQEADADTVLLLNAPENDPNTLEIIVAKNRNGPTDIVMLTYLKHCNRFENYCTGGYGT